MRVVPGEGVRDAGEVATAYQEFARLHTRGVSPTFESWARGVADDGAVLEFITNLPTAKQQPNLVFAAARWLQPDLRTYAELRHLLLQRTEAWRAVVLTRATQTNEVARGALLLPVLTRVPGPLALIEVGASAGLCLLPDRWSYRYRGDVVADLDPAAGPSPVVVRCQTAGAVPVPSGMPQIVARSGVDLNPLDVHDDDTLAWLEALIWPEHETRRERLRDAVPVARATPLQLVRGDLNDRVAELVGAVSPGVTPVVFHTAVMAYLSQAQRTRFIDTVTGLACRWVSIEGRTVMPIDLPVGTPADTPTTAFTVALDGTALAVGSGHGEHITWFLR